MDQVFAMRQLSEKFLSKWKSLYVAYMELKKAYGRTNWWVLRMYGVHDDVIRGMKFE